MSNRHGSIPRPAAEFDAFFANLGQYTDAQCSGDAPRWTHIPPQARSALSARYTAWHAAYLLTLGPCTGPQRSEKNRLRKAADRALRDFINIYLRYHPDVTEADKRNMGLHVPDGTRTPAVPPEEGPVFLIVQMGPRMLGINYQYGQGRKGSKPPGVEGARIYYGVFDEPPGDPSQLPASVWATRCPHVITFREADRGKRAWFALKWEVRRGGEKGQSGWSEMWSEIIP